jgi:hypothetical protein
VATDVRAAPIRAQGAFATGQRRPECRPSGARADAGPRRQSPSPPTAAAAAPAARRRLICETPGRTLHQSSGRSEPR